MKTLTITIILAFATMNVVVSSAAAQEITLNPPDINGKLNTLVEQKMNTLMDARDDVQNQNGVRRQVPNSGEQSLDVNRDTFIYVVSDSRR